jgi:hypothetical protein
MFFSEAMAWLRLCGVLKVVAVMRSPTEGEPSVPMKVGKWKIIESVKLFNFLLYTSFVETKQTLSDLLPDT